MDGQMNGIIDHSQCACRILNKIANPSHMTFTGLKSMIMVSGYILHDFLY